MKLVLSVLMIALTAVAVPFSVQADIGKRVTSEDRQVNVARVVVLVPFFEHDRVLVNVVAEDVDGTEELAPSQKVYLTLFAKGAVRSADVTFELGSIFSLKSVKRVHAGVYHVFVHGVNRKTGMPGDLVMKVDARKSIRDIQKIRCDENDCDAFESFAAEVEIESTQAP